MNSKVKMLVSVASFAILSCVHTASADQLTVQNSGFDTTAPGTYGTNAGVFVDHWEYTCTAAAICGAASGNTAASGVVAISFAPSLPNAGFASGNGVSGIAGIIGTEIATLA